MTSRKTLLLAGIALVALVLSGCKTTGSAIQGVGGVFNKTGSAVRNLG